jgi:hypothetical protein
MKREGLARAVVAFGLPFTCLGQHYFQFVHVSLTVVRLILGVLVAYFLSAESGQDTFFSGTSIGRTDSV